MVLHNVNHIKDLDLVLRRSRSCMYEHWCIQSYSHQQSGCQSRNSNHEIPTWKINGEAIPEISVVKEIQMMNDIFAILHNRFDSRNLPPFCVLSFKVCNEISEGSIQIMTYPFHQKPWSIPDRSVYTKILHINKNEVTPPPLKLK